MCSTQKCWSNPNVCSEFEIHQSWIFGTDCIRVVLQSVGHECRFTRRLISADTKFTKCSTQTCWSNPNVYSEFEIHQSWIFGTHCIRVVLQSVGHECRFTRRLISADTWPLIVQILIVLLLCLHKSGVYFKSRLLKQSLQLFWPDR